MLSVEGQVATITLNRPHGHHALDRRLSDELSLAFRKACDTRSKIPALLLRGPGNTFCAGDDIKDVGDWNSADPVAFEGDYQVRQYQETVQILEDMTSVTIAAVDGVCMGSVLELTLVGNFVIATDRPRWGMPEIDWGITTGWCGISSIYRHAGRHHRQTVGAAGGCGRRNGFQSR